MSKKIQVAVSLFLLLSKPSQSADFSFSKDDHFSSKWMILGNVISIPGRIREKLVYQQECAPATNNAWLNADLMMGMHVCKVAVESEAYFHFRPDGGEWKEYGNYRLKVFVCNQQEEVVAAHSLDKCHAIIK